MNAAVVVPPGEGCPPDDQGRDGAAGRSVLWRAASVIDAFTGGDRVVTLNDLSRRSGLPKSTAHRFATQLVELGWLERDQGGYRIGMRLFEVGGLAGRRNRLRDQAVPHLQRLASDSRLAVQLGILDGHEVVYLERILIRGFELPTRDGGRMPAYCTALGKAMLAFADEPDVDRTISNGLPRRTPFTIVEPKVMRNELAAIREAGLAQDRGEAYASIHCIAAPIRGAGRAIGAISVTGPSRGVDFDALAGRVRAAAAAIWRDMFSSVAATS